jgi:hypothetical protein
MTRHAVPNLLPGTSALLNRVVDDSTSHASFPETSTNSPAGQVANAAFVTLDGNFLNRASELRTRYGITVGSPNRVWDIFAPRYSLVAPTELDLDRLLGEQQTFFQALRST